MTQTDAPAEPKLGRRRDPSRDTDILEATIDVLAEVGYERMTIDMVATRAKAGKATVYRRWDSKSELVFDAVACLKAPAAGLEELPDTGNLRDDLVAMVKAPATLADAQRKLQVMTGIYSLIQSEPTLGPEAYRILFEPRAAATRALIERAIERGEAPGGCDIDRLVAIAPSLAMFRVMILREPPDRAFFVSLIDEIVMPVVRAGGAARPA